MDLRHELCIYLDTLIITDDNIGDIRRQCFVPWDSAWNGIVRDETAAREHAAPEYEFPVMQCKCGPTKTLGVKKDKSFTRREGDLDQLIHVVDVSCPCGAVRSPVLVPDAVFTGKESFDEFKFRNLEHAFQSSHP